jgi:hypothetical protein
MRVDSPLHRVRLWAPIAALAAACAAPVLAMIPEREIHGPPPSSPRQAVAFKDGYAAILCVDRWEIYFPRCDWQYWLVDPQGVRLRMIRHLGGLTNEDMYLQDTFKRVGDRGYFQAAGWLWVTDGTPSGTKILEGIHTQWFSTTAMAAWRSQLYFTTGNNQNQPDGMAVTDGTPEGTRQVVSGLIPYQYIPTDERLFLVASGALWSSDGTADGTVPLHGLSGTATRFGERVLFWARDASYADPLMLWISDGTPAGTRAISAVDPGNYGEVPFVVVGAYAYAVTSAGDVVRTDGTVAGTGLVSGWGGTRNLATANGFLYRSTANAVWRSDAAGAGDELVASANAVSSLRAADDRVYFIADGVVMCSPGGAGSRTAVTVVRGTLGATVGGAALVYEATANRVWITDGTDAGTHPLLTARRNDRSPDLDDDGRADLLWRSASSGAEAWLMDGVRVAATGALAAPGAGAILETHGDYNGDGRSDLVWRNADGSATETSMDGLASMISAPVTLAPGGAVLDRYTFYGRYLSPFRPGERTPGTLLNGDFNRDGTDDFVVRNSDGSFSISLTATHYSDSSTTLVVPAGSGWSPVLAADFDADGKEDLVWAHDDGRVAVWLMDGARIRAAATVLAGGSGWRVAMARDLDGDGKADLLWVHPDGSHAAWLMDGLQPRAYGMLLGPGTGWTLAASEDYDGDGADDLAWRGPGNAYGLWLMQGLRAKAYRTLRDPGSDWELVP